MMSKRRQMQKVYVKLKNRSNAPMVVDVIMVLPLWRWVGVLTWRWHEGTLWNNGNAQCLDLTGSYTV